MSAFPQYGNIYPEIQSTIKKRGGNQLAVSQLKPWIRLASGYSNGLVLGSNLPHDSFNKRYGNESRAGRIGLNFEGHSVFEEKGPFSRGYRPSPTIDAISIENGSEGLSRKLTTQIKCYSLSQLDTITRYFLEPRFYVLAEWGWNTNEVTNSLAKLDGGADAAVCEMVSYVNLSTMKDKRKNSNGHYDAFLGVITGGGVTYGDDETYIVDVEVTTQGEIPAYLQQHKGTVKGIKTSGNGNDSSLTFDVDEIEAAEKASLLGKALFMYMFNDLPGAKQIQKVKDLMAQEKWLAEYNYINMNGNVKDQLLKTLKDVDVNIEGAESDARVPTSQPLISEERFIRVELAWEILNSIDADLLPKPISCGGHTKRSLDFRINIDNTICRAHKHMFSIDKTTLYVPNKLGPDFGLRAVLGSSKDLKGSFVQIKDGGLVTQNFAPNGLPDTNNFPQPVKLDTPGGSTYDTSLHKIEVDEYEWGYLKDLYINFDFFCTTMEKTGAVSKDVAIELLNGLASGVNLFWNFQLVNDGSKGKDDNGNEILQVVDTSFNGKPPTSSTELARFQAIGENSPFLEFQIKLEIAGAMANQVMAQQMTDESSLNVEDKVEQFTGLFANAPDPVAKKLHQLHREEYAEEEKKKSAERETSKEQVEKEKEEAWVKVEKTGTVGETTSMGAERVKDKFNTGGLFAGIKAAVEVGTEIVKDLGTAAVDVAKSATGNDTGAEEKDRESNFDLFMQKAGVFPKLNDPETMPDLANEWYDVLGSNDANLDDKTMVCATWADSQLLRQIYEYDLNPANTKIGFEKSAAKNPGYLPIEVTFKIHGVSGIKVGDVLRITDLPHVYRRKMLQVFNVSNTIDDDLWTTEVTAKLRNVDLA